MKFTLKDKNNEVFFTGTKQECRHFLKCRRLSRHEFTMQAAPTIEPAIHYTVPQSVEPEEKTIPFYKRMFVK